MKVVINECFGGFRISQKCAERMAELGSERAKKELEEVLTDPSHCFYGYGIVEGMEGDYERTDPLLIQAVEELGKEASTNSSDLHVVEIPDDVNWYIHNYDGNENIEEVHRSWS
jgi:hypothetical protein